MPVNSPETVKIYAETRKRHNPRFSSPKERLIPNAKGRAEVMGQILQAFFTKRPEVHYELLLAES